MDKDLLLVAKDDEHGRKLQDIRLLKKVDQISIYIEIKHSYVVKQHLLTYLVSHCLCYYQR